MMVHTVVTVCSSRGNYYLRRLELYQSRLDGIELLESWRSIYAASGENSVAFLMVERLSGVRR